jgi:hypothetical protein
MYMTKKITGGKWFWESSENNQTPVTQSESKPKNTFMSYFTLPPFLKSQPKTQDNAKPTPPPPTTASNMLGGKRKTKKSKKAKKSKKSKTSKAKK